MTAGGGSGLAAAGWRVARAVLCAAVLLTAVLLTSCSRQRNVPASANPTPARPQPGLVATESLRSAVTASPSPPPSPTEPAPAPEPRPTPTDQLAPLPPTPRPASLTGSYVRTQIEIVWPHGGAPAREATQANITAYLIDGPGKDPPPCDWQPVVRLWAAEDGQPAHSVAIGEKRMVTVGDDQFPAWDFNDIDVSPAREPTSKMSFFATVEGVPTYHNVWVHAVDARTIFPQPDMPAGVTNRRPAAIDARIEIVWPHDDAPVDKASLANVTVYLFAAGTNLALASEITWRPVVRLHRSLNNDAERPESAVAGAPRPVSANGLKFWAWDFNDVDVSAARDPLNRVYFWVTVDDTVTASNIWAHGADARTLLPSPDMLNSCR